MKDPSAAVSGKDLSFFGVNFYSEQAPESVYF